MLRHDEGLTAGWTLSIRQLELVKPTGPACAHVIATTQALGQNVRRFALGPKAGKVLHVDLPVRSATPPDGCTRRGGLFVYVSHSTPTTSQAASHASSGIHEPDTSTTRFPKKRSAIGPSPFAIMSAASASTESTDTCGDPE